MIVANTGLYNCFSLILLIFLPLASNCKRVGRIQDQLDRSVQFIAVDGNVTFSFRSEKSLLQCEVLVADTSYTCNKLEVSEQIWQAQLGQLDPDTEHRAVLNIKFDDTGESSSRTYHWRGKSGKTQNDYRFKLNMPLLTAEMVRLEMEGEEMPAFTYGCRVSTKANSIAKNIEAPLGITELTTSGFGEATAEYHKRNNKYIRLLYEKFATEQKWHFRYVLDQNETLFTLFPPALLGAVIVNSEVNVPLSDSLTGKRDAGKIGNNEPVEITWRIDNPSQEMLLSISMTSDDKETRGDCIANPKDEKMEIGEDFLQQLPAGKYTMLVQLRSTQQVSVYGATVAAWLVDAYDWRHGVFAKQ